MVQKTHFDWNCFAKIWKENDKFYKQFKFGCNILNIMLQDTIYEERQPPSNLLTSMDYLNPRGRCYVPLFCIQKSAKGADVEKSV